MIRLIRWIAHLLVALVGFLCLAYVIQAGVPGYPAHSTRDVIGFLGIGISLVGLVAAWVSEGYGGALALAGYLVHAAVDRKIVSVWASWAVPLAGILFIGLWWARRRGMDPKPEVAPRRAAGGADRQRLIAGAVAFALLALLAAEAVLPTPPLAPRTVPPARLAGRWEGRAKAVNAWGPPAEITLVISVNGDGATTGSVGAAPLLDARIAPNRSRLGKALGIRSDIIVRGSLRDPITPTLGLACPVVTFTADFEGQTLKGVLAGFDCRRGGKPEGTLQTAPLTLRKGATARR